MKIRCPIYNTKMHYDGWYNLTNKHFLLFNDRLDTEVNELERKPYLTPEEQDRLSKLRLEQEFQRRVQEMESKGEDGDDSDTDITERASVS